MVHEDAGHRLTCELQCASQRFDGLLYADAQVFQNPHALFLGELAPFLKPEVFGLDRSKS
jgi:hypothetical protein